MSKPPAHTAQIKFSMGFYFARYGVFGSGETESSTGIQILPLTIEEGMFSAIQRISKTWMSAHLKSPDANWNNWISRPFDIFP
ncbi:hypothetical protein Tco_1558579 [Tanacetum coccineum]